MNQYDMEADVLEFINAILKPAEVGHDRQDTIRKGFHEHKRIGFGYNGREHGQISTGKEKTKFAMIQAPEKVDMINQVGALLQKVLPPLSTR